MSSGVPEWWSPFPLWIIVPLFALSPPEGVWWLLYSIASVSFLLCNPAVLRGSGRLSAVSITVLAVLQALNIAWLAGGFSYGVEYQGKSYAVAVTAISAALLVILCTLCVAARRHPRFVLNVAFRWPAWFWLTLYAFPYLGELP